MQERGRYLKHHKDDFVAYLDGYNSIDDFCRSEVRWGRVAKYMTKNNRLIEHGILNILRTGHCQKYGVLRSVEGAYQRVQKSERVLLSFARFQDWRGCSRALPTVPAGRSTR